MRILTTWRMIAVIAALMAVVGIGLHQRAEMLRETCEAVRATTIEDCEMTATATWTSGGNDLRVTTTRGIAGIGETVPNNETVEAWRIRHDARVAAAKVEFPEDE